MLHRRSCRRGKRPLWSTNKMQKHRSLQAAEAVFRVKSQRGTLTVLREESFLFADLPVRCRATDNRIFLAGGLPRRKAARCENGWGDKRQSSDNWRAAETEPLGGPLPDTVLCAFRLRNLQRGRRERRSLD